MSTESQLLHFGTVGQHGPDLFGAGSAGLEDDVAAIGRPGREVVAAAIMSHLDPLLARDIH